MPASSSITRIPAVEGFFEAATADKFKGESTSGMDRIPQQRKLKMEGCAGSNRALDADFPGMFLDDAVRHGEAESRAAPVSRFGSGLGGEERIVDTLQVLRRNPRARVAAHGFDVAVHQRGHAQAAPAGHGFLGV